MHEVGKRIFVVEDEVLIAMMLEEMLEEMGFGVVESSSTLDTGMTFATQGKFDAAIVDLSLHGVSAQPITEILEKRQIPYVISSGQNVVPDGMKPHAVVLKPYQFEDIETALGVLPISPGRSASLI